METIGQGIEQLAAAWSDPSFGEPVWDGESREREPLPGLLRRSVIARDRYRCGWCGRQGASAEFLQADHIVPVAAGGADRSDNLQTLCQRCNEQKSNRLTIDVWAVKPILIVRMCHRDMSYDGEVEVHPTVRVFCAMCQATRWVEEDHAEAQELAGWFSRRRLV